MYTTRSLRVASAAFSHARCGPASRVELFALSVPTLKNYGQSCQAAYLSTDSSSIPRIASSSFWASIIPKAFRQASDPVSVAERLKAKATKSKEWNPATFFIIVALIIGSNAINMIALRNQRLNFSRRAEAKITLLREVIQRVKSGEDVDVEGLLGTGDPEKEQEWEEVMKEIEADDALWQNKNKNKKRAERAQKKLDQQTAMDSKTASQEEAIQEQAGSPELTVKRRPGFY